MATAKRASPTPAADPNILTEDGTPVAVSELRLYHRNPRKGDVPRIVNSLRTNKQYRAVCVNRGTYTGRANEVLAGNHTVIAARELEWSSIAVNYVDVDEDQAARIVAVDNRTGDLASNDDQLLAELLSGLEDIDGTGYDPGDLDALANLLRAEAESAVDDAADQNLLDATDRQGWPIIRAQVHPDIHQRWGLVDGDDDAAKVATLLDVAGY